MFLRDWGKLKFLVSPTDREFLSKNSNCSLIFELGQLTELTFSPKRSHDPGFGGSYSCWPSYSFFRVPCYPKPANVCVGPPSPFRELLYQETILAGYKWSCIWCLRVR